LTSTPKNRVRRPPHYESKAPRRHADGEDIEVARPMTRPKFLAKATDMVLKIALELDQQRQARQQRSDQMAVDILDVHLFEPTTPSRGLGF
jgi:hypothetical protein